jgi:hypothetical protein
VKIPHPRSSQPCHLPKHPSQFFPPPPGAAAGPPSQRTWQKEKDLAKTLFKRLLKAEALEKKKELAQQKKDRKKAEDKPVKAVYKQSLEAKIWEKQKQKDLKKEKK